jgi:hypothetical protein
MGKVLKNKLALGLFAFALALIGGPVVDAHAASGGLTISPTSTSVKLNPGDSYKGEMLVINQGELDVTYKVYATPYSVTGEEYKPYFSPIPGAVDITKWVTFGNTGGPLKIGNQHTIPYTITVPKGVGAGSYYATIFAETEDKGNSGVITRKRVGMVVYLRVLGDVVEKGSIATWDVPWIQEAPLNATLRMANEGSVHFQSKVKVSVSDLFGGVKFTYERHPEIIPQKVRKIPIVWEKGATFGLFKVDGEVSYLGKTEKLPTRIVFIADTPMRLLTVGMLLAFVATVVVLGRKRVASSRKS